MIDRQEVRIRYSAGQSADTIAAAMKTSRATIYRALRATTTQARSVGRPRHPLDIHIIAEAYRKGASISELARSHQCHRATILRALRREAVYEGPAPKS